MSVTLKTKLLKTKHLRISKQGLTHNLVIQVSPDSAVSLRINIVPVLQRNCLKNVPKLLLISQKRFFKKESLKVLQKEAQSTLVTHDSLLNAVRCFKITSAPALNSPIPGLQRTRVAATSHESSQRHRHLVMIKDYPSCIVLKVIQYEL